MATAFRRMSAARWHIEPLSERTSRAAGHLIERILRGEFSYAATLCADGDLHDMLAAYRRPGCAAWAALADGRVVGVVAVRETPSGALEVKRLYVDAAWRGRGVGRALLEVAHAWAEAEGYQQIVLTTTHLMTKAMRLYRACGYEETGAARADSVTLHMFRRTAGARPLGARVKPDPIPPVEEGCVAVLIERPRRLVEGWHWERRTGELVLTEYYPVPVPVNYGLAPAWTNPADDEPLDVIVLDDRRMHPGEVLICRPVGVLWRPDEDHKLLAEPACGAVRPVAMDEAYRKRVAAWWEEDEQPTGWSGPEGVPRLMRQCRKE